MCRLTSQVRSLAAQFGPALQAHLSLAFQDLQVYSQRRGPEEPTGSLSTEEAPVSPEAPTDLFQVLLLSQEEAAPCRYLLQEALAQRCPTLAVLAACQQVHLHILKMNNLICCIIFILYVGQSKLCSYAVVLLQYFYSVSGCESTK